MPVLLTCSSSGPIEGLTNGVAINYPVLSASGGVGPYLFSSSPLPAGLSLNPSTGNVFGTPTTNQPATLVTFSAVDSLLEASNNCSFSYLVNSPAILPFTVSEITFGPVTRYAGSTIQTTVTVTNNNAFDVTDSWFITDSSPLTVGADSSSFTKTDSSPGNITGPNSGGSGAFAPNGGNMTLVAGGSATWTVNWNILNPAFFEHNATLTLQPFGPTFNISGPVINVVVPTITITKTTSGASARAVGSVITSTVVVTNTGGSAQSGINIVDPVPLAPAGTTRAYVSLGTVGVTGNTAVGVGGVNDTLSIPAGGSATYTINDTVNNAGTYINTVTGTDLIGDLGSYSGQTVTVGNSNVIITKSTAGAPTRAIGSVIVSTLTVTNTGVVSATGVAILDIIPLAPPGTTRVWTRVASGGITPSYPATNTTDINFTGRTFPAGASVTFTINDTVNASGTYINTASRTTTQQPALLTVTGQTVTVLGQNIVTNKSTPAGPYTVGVPITSTLTISNTGTATGPAVTVVDPIPAAPPGTTRTFTSVAFGGATGNTPVGSSGISNVLTIPVGGSVVYTINDTPTTTGSYQNIATVNGTPFSGGPAGTVNAAPTQNIVTNKVTGAGPYQVGTPIVSTVTVSNTGPVTGPTVSVIDPIPAVPAGTTRTFTSIAAGGATGNTLAGVTGINDTLTIPSGGSVTYTINDTPNNTGTYQNIVTTNGTPFTGGPTGTVNPGPAQNIVTTKNTAAGPYTVGVPILSTVTVSNTGPVTGPTVSLVDNIPALPAGTTRTFTSIAAGGASGNTLAGITNINDTLTIPSGGSVTYTINDTPTTTGTYQNSVITNGGAPLTGGPIGVVNAGPAQNIVTVKTTAAGPYTVGVPIPSTVTISNTGLVTGPAVSVVDPIPAIPAGTTRTFTSVAAGGATGNTLAGITGINDTLVIPVGGSVVYSIIDTPIAPGSYQNIVTTNGTPFTGGPAGPVSNPAISDPNITKSTAGISPRLAGDQIISTVIVSNPAPAATATAVGLIFTDLIPPTPAGTTRVYSSVVTGGATGNTSGTGSINDVLTIPVNGTVTYTITDTVVDGGIYQNTASIPTDPPASGAPIVVLVAVVAITKVTAPGPFTVGVPILSTVTVTNSGTGPSNGYLIVDLIPVLPAGTTRAFTSIATGGATGNTAAASTAIIDTLNLPAGSTVTYTINDTPSNAGNYQNIVTGTPPGGAAGPPMPGGPITPVNAAPVAVFTLTKTTAAGPFNVGDPILSTVVVTNVGAATGVTTIVDPIPASPIGNSRVYTSVAAGGATGNTAFGLTGINDILTLPVGAAVTYTITDIASNPGNYQNIATITGQPPVPGGPVIIITNLPPVVIPGDEFQSDIVKLCNQVDVTKLCDSDANDSILLVTIATLDGDVIPTGSTEFPIGPGHGVYSTIGFIRSYYTDLNGNYLVVQPTNVTSDCGADTDFDKTILCDIATGDRIVVVVSYSSVGVPTTIAYNLDGTPYLGNINTDLQQCSVSGLESDPIQICAVGVSLTQWVVKDAGQPTGVVYYTNLLGVVVAAPLLFTLGSCPEQIVQRRIELSGATVWVRPVNVQSMTLNVRAVGNVITPPTITDNGGGISTLFVGDVESWSVLGNTETLQGTFSISQNANDFITIIYTELI